MGVSYQWRDDVILDVIIEQPWTWKEYIENMNPIFSELRDKQTPCATMVHIQKMGTLPKDGNILHILLEVDRKMPPNVFASAIVGKSNILTTFMNVLIKLRPHAKRLTIFCQNADEGRDRIYERLNQVLSHNKQQGDA